MPKNFSCNLGSINLSKFVVNPYQKNSYFDWTRFSDAVDIAVEALDTIIDENLDRHALKEQAENSANYRNIGLGAMGYSNMLFKLGLKYGSPEAIHFTDTLFRTMFESALKASNRLAIEKGAFPKCKPELIIESEIIKNANIKPYLLESIKTYGLRNCSLLSIAPNGSIATMIGCTGGCEPEFALSYTRRTDNLAESYEVYCQSVREYFEAINQPIDLKMLPDYFVTSKDIAWIDRIKTQAVMQKYIDTAISSTVNLPKETTVEEIEQLYLEAWKQGLKGITIYRSGCAREGILTTEDKSIDTNKKVENNPQKLDSIKETQVLPRGYVVDVSDDLVGYKRKLGTGCGNIYLEVYSDEFTGEPQETFINIGSSGGCERNYQFISRLISLALRGGIPIESIIDQAMSVRPCTAYVNRTKAKHDTSAGTSCPSAIGYALKDLYEKTKERFYLADEVEEYFEEAECTGNCESCHSCQSENIEEKKVVNPCPECGEELHFEGGCNICKSCGYSKCD